MLSVFRLLFLGVYFSFGQACRVMMEKNIHSISCYSLCADAADQLNKLPSFRGSMYVYGPVVDFRCLGPQEWIKLDSISSGNRVTCKGKEPPSLVNTNRVQCTDWSWESVPLSKSIINRNSTLFSVQIKHV
jgi:hypothetical protein